MLVFLSSDKGGTGRSVTGCNLAYRSALRRNDVCYLDFDFGSPTSGAIFDVAVAARGVESASGLHSYFDSGVDEPARVDVWRATTRDSLRVPARTGKLVLFPGDSGGGEFPIDGTMIDRCVDLFLRVEEEFDLCLVDLSAGRSWATEMVLAATARPAMAHVVCRWLVFHRWTSQHIVAAHGLVHGKRGLLALGERANYDRKDLEANIRFVPTVVIDRRSADSAGTSAEWEAWLQTYNKELQSTATKKKLGPTARLGEVPADRLLQWREQILVDSDARGNLANARTIEAFDELARKLWDDEEWEQLT